MNSSQSGGSGQQTSHYLLIEERHLAFRDVEPGVSPVEAFLNVWPRLEPHYGTMVERLKVALEGALNARCTISARVKSLMSIKKSIERRQSHRRECYKDVGEIFDDLHDLAGVRIVVDYPSGIQIATAFINQNFQLKSTNIFKGDRKVNDAWKPTFGSFQSANHHVFLHPNSKYPLSPFCGILFEIQVLSLAESLYNRLAHPLIYKQSSGELPVKDQKMIDVTHGLALCYWICLSCMEDRLEGGKTEEIPRTIREVAQVDGSQSANMDSFVTAMPYSMPELGADVAIEKCRDAIENFRTQTMSSDQLYCKLSAMLKAPVQYSTTNVNSGSGPSMQHHGSGNHTMYSAGGNITIGKQDIDDEIRNAFWVTDPQLQKADIEDRKGGLIKDSYRWILGNDYFKQWYYGDHPLLWLNGNPGKGKTMSVCGIINYINSQSTNKGPKINLSHFFCEASDSNLNNATSVLRGIVYSLIFQNHVALSYVQERYKEISKPLSDQRLAWPVLQRLFIGILGEIKHQKTYLVIDALNECSEDRDKLLEFIVQQSSSLSHKWLLSSRNWPDIKQVLLTCPALTELPLEKHQTDVSEAVGFYITHQVEILSTIKHYNPKRREAVELQLRSKANSTFLWVSLVCLMLKEIPSWQTMKKLHTFPDGLDALYGRMLEQIKPLPGQKRDFGFDGLYARIISFALSSFRPLHLYELYRLVDDEEITVEEFEDIIALCGSFLTVQRRFVYFIHDTAKDYLIGDASGFEFDQEQQHAILFSQSLNNLTHSLHGDILHLESDHPRTTEEALRSFSYQCIHWISHLSKCASSVLERELTDGGRIDVFLRRKFLFWVETLGYQNSVRFGITAMLKLEELIYNHNSRLKDLVQDQVRFIRFHKFGIMQRPLQVYPLLNFSPRHCLTRMIYESEAPNWFTLRQGVEDYWSPCILTMEGHKQDVKCVAFSHDGCLLASGSQDKKIRIWDVLTGTCLQTLDSQSCIHTVAFSPKTYELASASLDKTIKIWDANNGALLQTLDHDGHVRTLAYSKNGSVIVSGSAEGTITLFDTLSGVCIRTLVIDDSSEVFSIVFTHNDQILSCRSRDALLIWDLRTQADPHRIQQISDAFALSPTNDILALAPGSAVKLWDLTMVPHWGYSLQEADGSPVFSNDGSMIATESEKLEQLTLWRSCTGDSILRFDAHGCTVNPEPYFSPDSRIHALSDIQAIHIRHLFGDAGFKTIEVTSSSYDRVEDLAFSHTNRWLAVTLSNGSVSIWDIAGNHLSVLVTDSSESSYQRLALAFSHDDQKLALYDGKYLKLYESNKWRCSSTLCNPGPESRSFLAVVFSSDDRLIATTSHDSFNGLKGDTQLNLWNLETEVCSKVSHINGRFTALRLDTSSPLRLETNLGTFEIMNHRIQSLVRPKYMISKDRQWILQGTKRLLWLPPDFRPKHSICAEIKFCKACFKFKVAIVSSTKRVVFLTLP
ncbi:hypothetical protein FSHL1_010277 [Fusarium sambucinum]